MNSKHVMNFTELFESSSKETSTEDLIALAEVGVISWRDVIETAFDRGELAVTYWLKRPNGTFRSAAIFSGDRVVFGKVRPTSSAGKAAAGGKANVAQGSGAKAAYEAGAKLVIQAMCATLWYDESRTSARVPYELVSSTFQRTNQTAITAKVI
jgi:hypothetical protein